MAIGGKIIVANTGDDSLSIIDVEKDYKIETISFSSFRERDKDINVFLDSFYIGPYDLCVNKKLDKIYSANCYNNSVFKIDLYSNQIEDLVAVGSCPTCLKLYDNLIITSNSDSNSISIIDEDSFKLIESISVGEKPNDIEIDKETGKIFVSNSNGCSIEVIDLEGDNIDKIILKSNPIKIERDKDLLYVLSNKNNGTYNCSNISIIRLKDHNIIKSMDLRGIFSHMVKLKDENLIFLTNIETGFLYKIDIKKSKIISKIFLGGMPNKILYDANNFLYLTNIYKDIVTIINYKTEKVIREVEVGLEPNGIIKI